jgi:hypothetical protein
MAKWKRAIGGPTGKHPDTDRNKMRKYKTKKKKTKEEEDEDAKIIAELERMMKESK